MTRTIREWYFGEEDKEEIKRFSKEVSIIFKVEGYNPKVDMFEDYFNLEEFDFIPCILRALYDMTKIEELEKIQDYLDSVYDPTVKVGLQDIIKNSKKHEQTTKERLKEMLFEKDKSFDDFIDFVFTFSDDVKEKFVNWLVG